MSIRRTTGKHTYGAQRITVRSWGKDPGALHIGKYCSLANNLVVIMNGDHRTDWVTTYPFNAKAANFPNGAQVTGHPTGRGDIVIGNDVWIAGDVTIICGVTIGDGAVVAAGSHVVKDVEPYSVVGGNPAKHLKYRFDPETIAKLLQIKWWDWPDAKVNQFVPRLCSSNIADFIATATEI